MRSRKHLEAFSLFSFQDIITSVTGVLILLTLFLALQIVHSKSIGTATAAAVPDDEVIRSIRQTNEQINQLQQALSSGQQFLASFATLSPTSLREEETRLKVTIDRLKTEIRQLESDIASEQLEKDELVADSQSSSTNQALATVRNKVELLKQQLESLKTTNQIIYNIAPNAKKTAWLVDLATDSIRVSSPGSANSKLEFQDGTGGRAMAEFLAWASNRNESSDYFVLLVRPNALAKYREAYERLDKLGFAIGVDLLEQNATLLDLSDLAAPP